MSNPDPHRMSAIQNIPDELKRIDRWVTWSYQSRGTGSKPTKIPYNPKVHVKRASSTDPATWGTFDQAVSAVQSNSNFAGVGIVLDGSGLVGVDLDACIVDGEIDPAALALMDELGAQYIEKSPSGNGLRAFGYVNDEAAIQGTNGLLNGLKVELYADKRYLTVTGDSVKHGAIVQLKKFKETADQIRGRMKVDATSGSLVSVPKAERFRRMLGGVLSGTVYHDNLRDMAASLTASGLNQEEVEDLLYTLMDAGNGPRDGRWAERRHQIPSLVESARHKFAAEGFSDVIDKAKPDASRYKLLKTKDLRSLPMPQWRVKNILPATGLAAIYGPSGSGKSFLAFDLAARIATGKAWFGFRVKEAPVVYVGLEGESGFKLRAQAMEEYWRCDLGEKFSLVLQPFKIIKAQDIADLSESVLMKSVIFIDTLNRSAPEADENSSQDMGQIIEGAKELQARTDGLVVVIHHTGKEASRGLRGHSSLVASLDASIEVTRKGGQRGWQLTKSKEGVDGDPHSFSLEVVNLGFDEDGDALTSCAVAPSTPLSAPQKPITGGGEQVLDAFKAALAAAGTFVVQKEAWRREFYKLRGDDKEGTKRKAFNRGLDELVQAGQVGSYEGGYIENDLF